MEQESQGTPLNKNIASPFSTGGGGGNFERQVGTYYLAGLLLESVPRGLSSGVIKEVRFQRLYEGEPLDDLIVIAETATAERKLALQIKRDLVFGAKDAIFDEVIAACWQTFTASKFNRSTDRFGVCIGLYSKRVDEHYQSVLLWARNSASAQDFFKRISVKSLASEYQRSFVNLIRNKINAHLGEPVDDDNLWQFFKTFRILYFDFHSAGSPNHAYIIELLKSVVEDRNEVMAELLFDRLANSYAANFNQTAGSIDRETLRQRLEVEDNFPLNLTANCTDSTARRAADQKFDCEKLFDKYREQIKAETAKVRIPGDDRSHDINKVFVASDLLKKRERRLTHALTEFHGLMDAELRRRRNPLFDNFEYFEPNERGGTLRLDELLLRDAARAVIVAAPGIGKTTLIRYLIQKTLEQKEILPVFIELKTLEQQDFQAADGKLIELLFKRAIAPRTIASDSDLAELKKKFYDRLISGRVALFLDGFDEISGQPFFTTLRQAVKSFVQQTEFRQNQLFITTRPYAALDSYGADEMQELELAPFDRNQIEQFVRNYYSDDQFVKAFLNELQRRPELRELAAVPALLGFLLILFGEQQKMPEQRLGLYHELVQQLAVKWDEEKAVRREFKTTPARRVGFLEHLAFERLLNKSEPEFFNRLTFNDQQMLSESEKYCASIGQASIADTLAEEVKMTPLLRRVVTGVYAFAHLTIQEYLAAMALAKRDDCERIFCRSYFGSALCEMETLPMTLGIVGQHKSLFNALEKLPESLDYKKLRLQAKSLRYGEVDENLIDRLCVPLIEMVRRDDERGCDKIEYGYFDLIAKSFSGAIGQAGETVARRIGELLSHEQEYVRSHAVQTLKIINTEEAIEQLKWALNDSDASVKISAALAVSRTDGELAQQTLISELRNEDDAVRKEVAQAFWRINDAPAIEQLKNFANDNNYSVRETALEAITDLCEKEVSVPILIGKLQDAESWVRRTAVQELGEIGGETVVEALIQAAADEQSVAEPAIKFLGQIGGERAVEHLISIAAGAPGRLAGKAVEALGNLKASKALPLFIEKFDEYSRVDPQDNDVLGFVFGGWVKPYVRVRLAFALYQLGDERGVALLEDVLANHHSDRKYAAKALSRIKGKDAAPLLLNVLSKLEYKSPFQNGHIEMSSYQEVDLAITIGNILCDLKIKDLTLVVSFMADYLKQTKNSNDSNITNALNVLGHTGGRDAVNALLKASNQVDPTVQWAAVAMLGNIATNDESCVEGLLIKLMTGVNIVSEQAAKVLAKMDKTILAQGLRSCLRSKHRVIRVKAAQTIGYYAESVAINAELAELAANDLKETVRDAARQALIKLEFKQNYF